MLLRVSSEDFDDRICNDKGLTSGMEPYGITKLSQVPARA
jgi:hypothetical protein